MAGLMSFDELVADLKRNITVHFVRDKLEPGLEHIFLSRGKYFVVVKPYTDGFVYFDEHHTLRCVKEVALREAFRQVIAEVIKDKWGIDFNPKAASNG